ncbi:MAG: DUF59 domain-containing protein [Planctomycetes bacterium]|nr:DUF59 domain-containing protein [Planctomycetota bacterium]
MREDEVLEILRRVIDPELGVNVVDLGLIYKVEAGEDRIRVAMTATTPTCPVGPYLAGDVEAAIRLRAPRLAAVEVEMVWDPPWSPERMSAAAKEQLGW